MRVDRSKSAKSVNFKPAVSGFDCKLILSEIESELIQMEGKTTKALRPRNYVQTKVGVNLRGVMISLSCAQTKP